MVSHIIYMSYFHCKRYVILYAEFIFHSCHAVSCRECPLGDESANVPVSVQKRSIISHFLTLILFYFVYPWNSIITDPQVAVKFMAKQHKYERLKDFRLGSVFRQLLGHAAGTASGETHKRIRSTFDGCYSSESVAQTVNMMEQECKECLRQVVEDKKVLFTNVWSINVCVIA